jgi:hypothetical protein
MCNGAADFAAHSDIVHGHVLVPVTALKPRRFPSWGLASGAIFDSGN